MILALDQYRALSVFDTVEEAARQLEAIDVQQDAFEFCDERGQRYVPEYIREPRQRFGLIDIGDFKLVPDGAPDSELPLRFLERADHLEDSSVPEAASLERLQNTIQKTP